LLLRLSKEIALCLQRKKNQKKNELLDEAANSMLEDEVGEGSIHIASLQNGLEALFDCRFNLQSNHLNELFIKHSQMTKADLYGIKESQNFLGLKFDELVASKRKMVSYGKSIHNYSNVFKF
jgi:hypothetical protein